MAAAAASFRMVMLSMSFGLMLPIPFTKMSSKPPVASCSLVNDGDSFWRGTPSTTQRGWPEPLMLLVPLIRILDWVPGWPEVAETATPATSPCMRASTEDTAFALKLSPFMTATEPVMRLTVVWA